MSFPRYKFSKESKSTLLEFLRVANEAQLTKYCDNKNYWRWSRLLPPDPILLEKLGKSSKDKLIVIEESSGEESQKDTFKHETEDNKNQFILKSNNKCSTDDIAFVIKENLETLNELSQSAKESINNCPEQEELFKILTQSLNNEEIFYLGESLQRIGSNDLVTIFCHFTLIPQLQNGYCDRLSALIESLYNSKYFSVLNKELLIQLLNVNDDDIKIILQYLNNIQSNYKSFLLRDFLFSIEVFNKNHLSVVEPLLNEHLEYEALNKLVEMLSNIAEDYTKDKAFGKLLMNVIQCLGNNVSLLEQPLKHIIASHKSIWKSKLEKTFNTHYEDTLMFSQSFRE